MRMELPKLLMSLILENVWLIFLGIIIVYAYLLYIGNYQARSFYCNIIVLYFVTSIFIPLLLLRPRNPRNIQIYAPIVGFLCTTVVGWKWQWRGLENIPKDKSGVIVINHQHSLDALTFVMMSRMIGKLSLIQKRQLLSVVPFGFACYLMGAVFPPRDKSASMHDKLKPAMEMLDKHPGCKIGIFAEGTRNNAMKTGKLLTLRNGAFWLAIKKQVPIFPTICSPMYFHNPEKGYFHGGPIAIQFLPPIETTGLTEADIDSLREKTQKIMQDAFDKLWAEFVDPLPKNYPSSAYAS